MCFILFNEELPKSYHLFFSVSDKLRFTMGLISSSLGDEIRGISEGCEVNYDT